MKITVELDDGRVLVYDKVSDAYLSVHQCMLMADDQGRVFEQPVIRSNSWGSNLRELVKEVSQSVIELQDLLREHRNASAKRSDRGMAVDRGEHPERVDEGDDPRR